METSLFPLLFKPTLSGIEIIEKIFKFNVEVIKVFLHLAVTENVRFYIVLPTTMSRGKQILN